MATNMNHVYTTTHTSHSPPSSHQHLHHRPTTTTNSTNTMTTTTTTKILNNHHQHPQQPPPPPPAPASQTTWSPLPSWVRFYFYGMHGVLDEVVFTALFDLVFSPQGNRQLKGYTTLTSFLIYGSCSFAMETCFVYCTRRGYPMFLRVLLYVLSAYVWEFSFGLLLRQFDACSWDYSHYPLNLLGLITLLYAPGWVFLGIVQDYMYRYLFSLHVKRSRGEKLQ